MRTGVTENVPAAQLPDTASANAAAARRRFETNRIRPSPLKAHEHIQPIADVLDRVDAEGGHSTRTRYHAAAARHRALEGLGAGGPVELIGAAVRSHERRAGLRADADELTVTADDSNERPGRLAQARAGAHARGRRWRCNRGLGHWRCYPGPQGDVH